MQCCAYLVQKGILVNELILKRYDERENARECAATIF